MVNTNPDAEREFRTASPVTPDELRRIQFKRAVRGYDAREVDDALERARDGYEQMWRERSELAVEVEELRRELSRYQNEQDLVRDVLITAQKTATGIEQGGEERAKSLLATAEGERTRMLGQARAASEQLLSEARAEAERRLKEAAARVDEDMAEARRLKALHGEMAAGYRAFLLAALELLESPTALEPRANGGRGEARQAEPSGEALPAGRKQAHASA